MGEEPIDILYQPPELQTKLREFSLYLYHEMENIASRQCHGSDLSEDYSEMARTERNREDGYTEVAYESLSKRILLAISWPDKRPNEKWISIQDIRGPELFEISFYLDIKTCTLMTPITQINGVPNDELFRSSDLSPMRSNIESSLPRVIVAIFDYGHFYLGHERFAGKWLVDELGHVITPNRLMKNSYLQTSPRPHSSWVSDIALRDSHNILGIPVGIFCPEIVGFLSPLQEKIRSTGGQEFLKLVNRLQYDQVAFVRNKGASVINMSFGSVETFEYNPQLSRRIVKFPPGFNEGYRMAMREFNDLTFVVLAGNGDGLNLDNLREWWIQEPRDNVIVVGAVDRSGKLASYSSIGPKMMDFAVYGEEFDLIAPVTIQNMDQFQYGSGMSKGLEARGTSFSAPRVTRIIAKMKQIRPDLAKTPRMIKEFLCQNVIPDVSLEKTTRCGGYISEEKIMSLLKNGL